MLRATVSFLEGGTCELDLPMVRKEAEGRRVVTFALSCFNGAQRRIVTSSAQNVIT